MKKASKLTGLLVLLFFAGLMLNSCKKHKQEGNVTVQLTDDPFPYSFVSAANITISKVELKNEATDNYVTVFSGSATINIANYINGNTAELTMQSVPAGTYKKVRITLEAASVVLIDGRTLNAAIDDATVDVEIEPALTVTADGNVDLLLDFDLSDSFEFTGFTGDWFTDVSQILGISEFDPDFRAVNLNNTGSISGQVVDINNNPVAYAEVKVKYDYDNDGMDDDVSTIADDQGHFTILGLPAGSYTLEVDADNYNDAQQSVGVTVGQTTEVTVTLQP